ncbi:MAG TPA: SDR family NAD(P)-dependent oxidoreductase [Stellaceae bacterium]|nr:SDR family NAD(P)-dependent oxidoreductase [Stellaceae bacterium]
MSVAGKTIAITGAARGLGQAFACHLAARGANVVLGDRSDCSATLGLVTAAGGRGLAVPLDVTDPASAQAMAAAATGEFGGLNGLINNAALYGALHGGRFDAIDEAEWDACMAVNVKGIWNCCKAAVPAMRQSISQGASGGSIVNIASLAATYGMPYGLHYTTSKAAVIGLTRGLARELGRDRIRVNALAPSAVLTEGTSEFFGDKLDRALQTIKASQTIQRNLVPDDLTGTVTWLLSEESQFVTGQTIAVDGGTVML